MELQSIPTITEYSPFAYFVNQSSVVPGLGGSQKALDPKYCFHTEYKELNPGLVNFLVRLHAARADYGEITVRIHAYRPNSDLDVTLATSTQFELEGFDGTDAEIRLRICAIPGVQYAAYGYLSEPSDLSAIKISVIAEQWGGDSAESYAASELGHTAFGGSDIASLAFLVGNKQPNLREPQSQPITMAQLLSSEFASLKDCWPDITDLAQQWSQVFALRVLDHFKFLQPGARGLLIGESLPLAKHLRSAGCQIICYNPDLISDESGLVGGWIGGALQDLADSISHADFILVFQVLDQLTCYSALIDNLNAVLRCLLRGGVAVFIFSYWPDHVEPPAKNTFAITETMIKRIALHVIGHGSSIAQLLMPPPEKELLDRSRGIPFGLIVFR